MRLCFAWWAFTWGREVEPRAFLQAARDAGSEGVEMLPPPLWPLARELGLAVPTYSASKPERGFNDPARHPRLSDEVRRAIALCAGGGVPNLVVFSGDRRGRSDADGIAACVDGLGPLAAEAAAAGVTLLLELLNSKVDHPDYQCDRTAWGVEVVRQVASPGLKLLYDAYHMQIMEGDLLRTLKAHLPLIGHVHTAGVPGRRDLDGRQEVNWPGIAGLLRHLGYDGWVGHELIPRGDPLAALAAANRQFGWSG